MVELGTPAQLAGGVLAGLLWAALGWYRFHQKHPTHGFDPKNFAVTIAIGGIIGFLFPEALGQPLDIEQTPIVDFLFGLASAIGPVAVIDKVLSILFGKAITSETGTPPVATAMFKQRLAHIPGLRNILNLRF